LCARQLESLIRLSEAKAKAELRDVVTEEDARVLQEDLQHLSEPSVSVVLI
jgi:DNA replicative helicase MCM subunit Mcm2 (Cdc46/Mcm family)